MYLIRKLFKIGDADHTGSIDMKEFHRLLYELQLQNPDLSLPKSENDIQKIFNHLDADKSGLIDEPEFVKWVSAGLKKDKNERSVYKTKATFINVWEIF